MSEDFEMIPFNNRAEFEASKSNITITSSLHLNKNQKIKYGGNIILGDMTRGWDFQGRLRKQTEDGEVSEDEESGEAGTENVALGKIAGVTHNVGGSEDKERSIPGGLLE